MALNPYVTLGVSYDASFDEVKEAYQREILRWHPDKCRDENSTNRFLEIRAAWDILSEKNKKSQYDNLTSPNIKLHQTEIVCRGEFLLLNGVYSKNCRCGDKFEV